VSQFARAFPQGLNIVSQDVIYVKLAHWFVDWNEEGYGKRWKAEGRFPLSHNLDCCCGHEFVDVSLRGLKPEFFVVAFFGTDKSVPFQGLARM
jgi:hypothetical protein